MLALFGCPYLGDVLAAYEAVHPLRDGWQDRVGLHQLYPLLAHVVLFGGSYARQVAVVVAQLLNAIS
jgi:fructosamine-3-kinase